LKPDPEKTSGMPSKSVFRHFWPSFSWGIFILILTGIPGQLIPQVPSFMDLFEPDKLVHLFIFGVFVYLLMHGFISSERLSFGKAGIASLLISIAFGGMTELLQAYIFTNRNGSIYDVIADTVGSVLVYLVCIKRKSVVTGKKD
jgi:hypothetical protein